MKQKHKKKISNVNLVAMKRSLILLSCVTAVLGCTSEDPKRELCFLSTPVAYANRVIEGSTLRLRTMPELSAAELQWTGPNGFISNEQSPILPNMSSEMAGIYYVKKISENCESLSDSVHVALVNFQNPNLPDCIPTNMSEGYWSEVSQKLTVNHPQWGSFDIVYNGAGKLVPGIYQSQGNITMAWNYGSVMNVIGAGNVYVSFTDDAKVKISFCDLPLSYYSVSGGFSGSHPPINGNFISSNSL